MRAGYTVGQLGSGFENTPLVICLRLLFLLQPAHPFNVQGLEATGIGALVGWKLFMAGFQTDAARVTDSDNNHAARGAFSARIFFLWEGDADFGHRARWRAVGVFHQAAFLVIDKHGVGLIRGNSQAASVGGLSIVDWEHVLIPGLALAAEDEQTTD